MLISSVTVPRNTELTFQITVFNDTNVEYGFDNVVSTVGSGYDNENIIYTLTNLKRPYTVDGEMADDVTRIPGKRSHTFEITFKIADGVTDFSNVTLNSVLNFIFKPFSDINPDRTTSPVDGALDQFKKILNTPDLREELMDNLRSGSFTGKYIGNVVGSSESDSTLLKRLFEGNLNLMLPNADGVLTKTNLTCMIKQRNLVGDSTKEMTIYMTPDDLTNKKSGDSIKNVYVAVFKLVGEDANGNQIWEQYGELYHGIADCNDYSVSILDWGFDPSLNTDSWESSQVYHGVKAGKDLSTVIKAYEKTQ
jgi:hypothetical protein